MTISRLSVWALALSTLSLAACSALPSRESVTGALSIYRLEVVQGNVVTKEQFAQVKEGMPRAQVREILGSPLLTDIFHGDRWDWVFSIRRQGVPAQERRVTAWFEGDRLKKIEAPELPSEEEFVAAIDARKLPEKKPLLTLTPEQIAALPKPAEQPKQAEPPLPVRKYPPLEDKR